MLLLVTYQWPTDNTGSQVMDFKYLFLNHSSFFNTDSPWICLHLYIRASTTHQNHQTQWHNGNQPVPGFCSSDLSLWFVLLCLLVVLSHWCLYNPLEETTHTAESNFVTTSVRLTWHLRDNKTCKQRVKAYTFTELSQHDNKSKKISQVIPKGFWFNSHTTVNALQPCNITSILCYCVIYIFYNYPKRYNLLTSLT
jgi:hypothetical protein